MPPQVNPPAEEPEETGHGECAEEVRHLDPEPAPSSDEMLDILAEACEDEEGIDIEIVPQVHTVPIKRPGPQTFWRTHPKHAPTLVTFIHRPEGKPHVYYWVPNAYLSAFDPERPCPGPLRRLHLPGRDALPAAYQNRS